MVAGTEQPPPSNCCLFWDDGHTHTKCSWFLLNLLTQNLIVTTDVGSGQKVFWLLTWHMVVFKNFKRPKKPLPEVKRTSDNAEPSLICGCVLLTMPFGTHLPPGANSRAAKGRALGPGASVPRSDLQHRTPLPHLPWVFCPTALQVDTVYNSRLNGQQTPPPCSPATLGQGRIP